MEGAFLKPLAAFVIAIAGAAGLFPLFGARRNQKGYLKPAGWIGISQCFAGGVFLAAGLVHILPDAAEMFNDDLGQDYPIAGSLAVTGYLLVYSVEQIVEWRMASKAQAGTVQTPRSPLNHSVVSEDPEGATPLVCPHNHHGENTHHSHFSAGLAATTSSSEAVVLLVALSLHSFFAGLALGSTSDVGAFTGILIAILAHKMAATFSLAVSLATSPLKKKLQYILGVVFVCVTPSGVLLAVAMENLLGGVEGLWTQAVLTSLAGGTFIFVAQEVIQNGMESKASNIMGSILAVLVGAGGMMVLAIWT